MLMISQMIRSIGCLTALTLMAWPVSGRCQQVDPPLTEADQIQPAEGVARIPPGPPDWCGSYKDQMKNVSSPVQTIRGRIRDGYDRQLLQKIAWAACDQPNSLSRQQWVANWRQGYVNQVGWSESEDRAAMKVWALDSNELTTKHRQMCQAFPPDRSASASERVRARAKLAALQCPHASIDQSEWKVVVAQAG